MEFNVKKITKCAPHTGKSGEYYVVTVSDDNNNMAYAQFTRAQIKSANQIDKLHQIGV